MTPATTVSEAVATRRSIRAFLDKPVDPVLLRSILEKAQRAPSGGNVQPWEIAVVSGDPLKALIAKVTHAATTEAPGTYREYPIYPDPLPDPWMQRRRDVAMAMYDAMGIERNDKPARAAAALKNLTGFGAPVVLFLHCPKLMGPPQWGDMGLWLQTVMLLLREAGLDSCPQEAWSTFGKLIRMELALGDDNILWTGLAIGWRDAADPVNNFASERASLDYVIRWFT